MTGLNTCRKPYVCAGANSKGAAEEELENLNRKAAFYISKVFHAKNFHIQAPSLAAGCGAMSRRRDDVTRPRLRLRG